MGFEDGGYVGYSGVWRDWSKDEITRDEAYMDEDECPACNGAGYYKEDPCAGMGLPGRHYVYYECEHCMGTGKYFDYDEESEND